MLSVAAWTKFCQSTLQGARGAALVRSLEPQTRQTVHCRDAFNWQNFFHPQYSVRTVMGVMKNARMLHAQKADGAARAQAAVREPSGAVHGGAGLCRRFASLPEASTDARLLSPSFHTSPGHIRSPSGPYRHTHGPHTTVPSGLYAHVNGLRVRRDR